MKQITILFIVVLIAAGAQASFLPVIKAAKGPGHEATEEIINGKPLLNPNFEAFQGRTQRYEGSSELKFPQPIEYQRGESGFSMGNKKLHLGTPNTFPFEDKPTESVADMKGPKKGPKLFGVYLIQEQSTPKAIETNYRSPKFVKQIESPETSGKKLYNPTAINQEKNLHKAGDASYNTNFIKQEIDLPKAIGKTSHAPADINKELGSIQAAQAFYTEKAINQGVSYQEQDIYSRNAGSYHPKAIKQEIQSLKVTGQKYYHPKDLKQDILFPKSEQSSYSPRAIKQEIESPKHEGQASNNPLAISQGIGLPKTENIYYTSKAIKQEIESPKHEGQASNNPLAISQGIAIKQEVESPKSIGQAFFSPISIKQEIESPKAEQQLYPPYAIKQEIESLEDGGPENYSPIAAEHPSYNSRPIDQNTQSTKETGQTSSTPIDKKKGIYSLNGGNQLHDSKNIEQEIYSLKQVKRVLENSDAHFPQPGYNSIKRKKEDPPNNGFNPLNDLRTSPKK
ncbi:hypothetical protein PPACK8108_LOCUS6896 [Phakopsora pachyrhizi]|uniref:Uncharacterized protein n=1 Tax=Phakopsora pachyrhizi TaxID=170000 RepID=A0AAV0ARU6_PHAPC|nr:hypothetical protein PPACK8108_LOCUS6896 [Phakopsora pachyrhizi]